MATRSLEFGEREFFEVTKEQLVQAGKEREEEMAEALARYEAQREGARLTGTRYESEIAELKQQRMQMALSLAQYASLEAEWGGKDEEAAASVATLTAEYKGQRQMVGKLPALEEMIAQCSHEDVARLKYAHSHLTSRLEAAEGTLASLNEEREALRAEVNGLMAEDEASTWMAREEADAREQGLRAQAVRLKEGLAMRCFAQSLLRTAGRCFKAWTAFVVRHRLKRQLHMEISDDETDAAPPAQASALAETMSSMAESIKAIPSLF